MRIPLDDELRAAIGNAKRRIVENCTDLIEEGTEKFREERFPRSCFLAMAAIEEAGKLAILRVFAHAGAARQPGMNPPELDANRLGAFIRDHPQKAWEAAASSLYVNAAADRRHGKHPGSGIRRTSGLMLLARSGRWVSIRNSCIYVDLEFRPPKIGSPRAAISRALAFYMVCMAHEVVAEQGASAIEDVPGELPLAQEQIAKLQEFMNVWGASSDIDSLPFLSAPDQFRDDEKRRERPVKNERRGGRTGR